MYNFVLYCFLAGQGSAQFVRIGNNKYTPNIYNYVLNNVLRTFEAEILKFFKNI